MKTPFLIITIFMFSVSLISQTSFDSPKFLAGGTDKAFSVCFSDLNNNGYQDIICSSDAGSKISWHYNLGNGEFGSQNSISTTFQDAWKIISFDLDGDHKMDLLTGSYNGGLAWYKNEGDGVFSPRITITNNNASNITSINAIDLDNDSDLDILFSSFDTGRIAWIENQGGGILGSQQIITSQAWGTTSTHVKDMDNDGDLDIFYSALFTSKLSWHENLGNGNFWR